MPRNRKLLSDLRPEERALGMDRDISRRDFVNSVAVGAGATLLAAAAPACAPANRTAESQFHIWNGPGGVGDYARSNGNTWDVVQAGHGIRDKLYLRAIAAAPPTGETYDLVIVGGGFAGATAAYRFLKETDRRRSCLMLDNHPLIGGEAKRNEFLIRGHRLMGPQGSNGAVVGRAGPGELGELFRDIGIPAKVEYGKLAAGRKPMEFPLDNYMYQLWWDTFESHGYFFDTPTPHWVTNPFGHGLEGVPWSDALKRDLLRWRAQPVAPFEGDWAGHRRFLDSMTYDDYLTKHRGFTPSWRNSSTRFWRRGSGSGPTRSRRWSVR